MDELATLELRPCAHGPVGLLLSSRLAQGPGRSQAFIPGAAHPALCVAELFASSGTGKETDFPIRSPEGALAEQNTAGSLEERGRCCEAQDSGASRAPRLSLRSLAAWAPAAESLRFGVGGWTPGDGSLSLG